MDRVPVTSSSTTSKQLASGYHKQATSKRLQAAATSSSLCLWIEYRVCLQLPPLGYTYSCMHRNILFLSLSGFLLSGEEARVPLHFPWTRRRQQAQNRSVPSEHKDYLLCGAELAELAGRRAADCLLLTETKVSSSRDQSAARPKCKTAAVSSLEPWIHWTHSLQGIGFDLLRRAIHH